MSDEKLAEALLEWFASDCTIEPPPLCTGTGTLMANFMPVMASLPSVGLCGICGQYVPVFLHDFTLKAHPYLGIATGSEQSDSAAPAEPCAEFMPARVGDRVICEVCLLPGAAHAPAEEPLPLGHPFEPCDKGESGDPKHNFTCALLCVHCGQPEAAHERKR